MASGVQPVSLRGKAGNEEGDAPIAADSYGQLLVRLRNSANQEIATAGAWSDATANGIPAVVNVVFPFAFNGATWDRARGNVEATLLASAARTATVSSSDQTNYNGRGVEVIVDVSSAGTGSITVAIQAKDPISGNYVAVLTSAALVANGTTRLRVYPGITASANVAVSDTLVRTWRVNVTHNNANSISYSVSAITLV